MQIKTALIFYLPPVSMSALSKQQMLVRIWPKESPLYTAGATVNLYRIILAVSSKHDPAVPLPSVFPKVTDHRDACVSMVTAAQFTTGQLGSHLTCSNGWNYVICRKMGAARDHRTQRIEPISESLRLCLFSRLLPGLVFYRHINHVCTYGMKIDLKLSRQTKRKEKTEEGAYRGMRMGQCEHPECVP